METERSVTAEELCWVLTNLELRIRILKELMCSIAASTRFPVPDMQWDAVSALVKRKSVANSGCQGTP